MDIPNARSSHSAPTPRGGGLAIVISYLLGLPVLGLMDILSWCSISALLGAGILVALVGFLDDQGHIAARWRLIAHFCAAAWILAWFGGVFPLALFGTTFAVGWVETGLAAIYLVWLLNLYNFMDGIDGIASVEAICVCAGGALLYILSGYPALAAVPLLLAASVAGFLFWNFPPAQIFMGDVGSGFLGIILGALSLQAGWLFPEFFWSWIIMLGVFICDATFTLIRRLLRGDKIYEAHRSHAYQYAARQFGRHLPVTLTVGAINLIWLLPLSLLVGFKKIDILVGIIISYAPLVLLMVKYRAGELEVKSS